jgi:hypothetical protein
MKIMKTKIRIHFYSLFLIGVFFLHASGCKKNENNNNNNNPPQVLVIGQSYQGGKIAYILMFGDPGFNAMVQHGIIAAPNDLNGTPSWGCDGTIISGADGTAIGTGNQNTIDIVNGCSTAGIAAKLCNELTLDGYSDWYLPSKDELNKLYINKVLIGGFSSLFYWSSSEASASTAWGQNFSYGGQYGDLGKYGPAYVRPVRSF